QRSIRYPGVEIELRLLERDRQLDGIPDCPMPQNTRFPWLARPRGCAARLEADERACADAGRHVAFRRQAIVGDRDRGAGDAKLSRQVPRGRQRVAVLDESIDDGAPQL